MSATDEFEARHELLLMEYASGALDEAGCLLVASYLTLSAKGRRAVSRHECVGGALMQSICTPVAMDPASLQAVLRRIGPRPASAPCDTARTDLPRSLQSCVGECRDGWRQEAPGVEMIDVPVQSGPRRARLLKIAPGVGFAIQRGDATRVMLVLKGGCANEARAFHAGDMIMMDGTGRLIADAQGCLLMDIAGENPRRSLMDRLMAFFR